MGFATASLHTPTATFAVALLAGAVVAPASAQDSAPSATLYAIGGGAPVTRSLNPRATVAPLADRKPQQLLCDVWDGRHKIPSVSFDMVKTHLEEQVDGLTGQVITGIKTLGLNAAMAAFQNLLPAQFEDAMNTRAAMQFDIDVAKRSCQAAAEDIEAGRAGDWIKTSGGLIWGDMNSPRYGLSDPTTPSAGVAPATHILKAQDTVVENAASTGVPWFGERRGHANDAPIELVPDIIAAGYNAYVGGGTYTTGSTIDGAAAYDVTALSFSDTAPAAPGGSADAADAGTVSRNPRLTELWPNSDKAREFALTLVGNESIAYCLDDCETTLTPKLGIKVAYEREIERLTGLWNALFRKYGDRAGNMPRPAELSAVSDPSNPITKQAYVGLLGRKEGDRKWLVERHISASALQLVAEKAIALRDLIRAGASTPDVLAYPMAREKAEEMMQEIREELESLRFEVGLTQELAGETAATILGFDANARLEEAGVGVGGRVSTDRTRISGGRPIVPAGGASDAGSGDTSP